MAAKDPLLLARLGRQGYGALAPVKGLDLLAATLAALHRPTPAVITASLFYWPRLLTGAQRRLHIVLGLIMAWPSSVINPANAKKEMRLKGREDLVA